MIVVSCLALSLALMMVLAACDEPTSGLQRAETLPTPELTGSAPLAPTTAPSEAWRIPGKPAAPERLIDQSSPTCPATPLEALRGPAGLYFEREAGLARSRESADPWRAGQARTVIWLPSIYYAEPTFEILAERLDGGAGVQVFIGSLEGAGYRSEITASSPGCWRLTARLGEDRASVVVLVEP